MRNQGETRPQIRKKYIYRLLSSILSLFQAKPSTWLKPVALRKLRGRYLTHQEGLPHLPVPPLQQTLDRYLLMLEPIISEEELSHTKDLVRDFRKPGGVGERLQKGLERRARKNENWVGGTPGPGGIQVRVVPQVLFSGGN